MSRWQESRPFRIQGNPEISQRDSILGSYKKERGSTHTGMPRMPEEREFSENGTERPDRQAWADMNSDVNRSYYQAILKRKKRFNIDNSESILGNDILEGC